MLLGVLALFTVGNFQRERELVKGSLEQQGLTLIRFINSTVREDVRKTVRSQGKWLRWDVHMLGALELAVEQPGVQLIRIVGQDDNVFLEASSSSYPKEEGERPQLDEHEKELLRVLQQSETKPYSSLMLIDPKTGHKTFLLAASHRLPMMQNMTRRHGKPRRPPLSSYLDEIEKELSRLHGMQPVFIVRFDFEKFNGPLKNQFTQIILQLFVITLVGIGGALSFLTLRWLKGAEKNLGEVTAFNESLVSSLPVGVVATDGNDTIQLCNTNACTILNLVEEDTVGRLPTEVIHADLASIFTQTLPPGGLEIEKEFRVNDSEIIKSLNLLLTAVTSGDEKSLGRVLLVRDMTQMRTLEKELQKSERMASLGRMAAGVAHELRNPLSSIKGLALLLKPNFKSGSKEEENTETLVKEVERLNRGIGELLDFAKPARLLKKDVSIEDIVTKTMNLVEADAHSYNIQMKLECSPDCASVYADNDKISQVLLNIFLNAIQAMEDIEPFENINEDVKKGVLRIKIHQKEKNVFITITDSGKGIKKEFLKRVFDPYFTTKSDGTGLGLALSAKIVEEHGGKIEISSIEGSGTVVTLRLPSRQT